MLRVGKNNPRRTAKYGKIWISRGGRGREITQGNRSHEGRGAGTCTEDRRGNNEAGTHGLKEKGVRS